MDNFIVVFLVFVVVIALMAVGVIFKRRPISGSCGGLANIGIDKACDCDKPCANKKWAMRKKLPGSPQKYHQKAAPRSNNHRHYG